MHVHVHVYVCECVSAPSVYLLRYVVFVRAF